jgi:hypothetical protein
MFKTMKVKNLILGIGIFIVFMFLLHNGIRAFYQPSPKYDDFCMNRFYPSITKPLPDGQSCTYTPQLRQEEEDCYSKKGQPIHEYDEFGCSISVLECDLCQVEYQNALNNHNKVVFIIALITGIIALLVGYTKLSIEPVGSSLMASGIGAIIYGTISNWENLGNLGRFFLLLIAFVLLVWIAIKLNLSTKKSFLNKIGFEN